MLEDDLDIGVEDVGAVAYGGVDAHFVASFFICNN